MAFDHTHRRISKIYAMGRETSLRLVSVTVSFFTVVEAFRIFRLSNDVIFTVKSVFLESVLLGAALFLGVFLLNVVYRRIVERHETDSDQRMAPQNWRALKFIFSLSLAAVSFTIFLTSNPTAYQNPSIDMGPFFERVADRDFAPGDFFTNASMQPNPRWIFGYLVVFVTRVFQPEWYTVFFFIKALTVVALPPLFYLLITKLCEQYLKNDQEKVWASVLVFAAVASLNSSRVLGFFGVAWWKPWIFLAAPQTVSLLLAGLSMFFVMEGRKWANRVGMVIWFLATLVHPAVGILSFVFFSAVWRANWRKLIVIAGFAVVAPAVLIKAVFPVESPLGAQEFVDYYVKNAHAQHYLPSLFGSYTSFPWYVSYVAVFSILVAGSLYFRGEGRREARMAATLLSVAYLASLVMQFLFVEVYPVKAVAMLGPSRYFSFGFWSVVFVTVLIAVEFLSKHRRILVFSTISGISRKQLAFLLVLVICVYVGVSALFQDDPVNDTLRHNADFAKWVEGTSPNSTFIVPPNSKLSADMRLVYRRSIFVGGGFPFYEGAIREFDLRKKEVYGDFKSVDPSVSSDTSVLFYEALDHQYFVNLSKDRNIDYVVYESGPSEGFPVSCQVFSDGRRWVYSLKCAN